MIELSYDFNIPKHSIKKKPLPGGGDPVTDATGFLGHIIN
jgi:hypothetical protein